MTNSRIKIPECLKYTTSIGTSIIVVIIIIYFIISVIRLPEGVERSEPEVEIMNLILAAADYRMDGIRDIGNIALLFILGGLGIIARRSVNILKDRKYYLFIWAFPSMALLIQSYICRLAYVYKAFDILYTFESPSFQIEQLTFWAEWQLYTFIAGAVILVVTIPFIIGIPETR